MANKKQTPLLSALREYAGRDLLRFHMPGHKGRALPGGLWPDICALDVTELPCTGDLYRDTGDDSPIRRAERLCAGAYGMTDAMFLTGGSSQGIFSMLFAFTRPGDCVIVDRMCHQSVCHAMALLDLNPVYLFRDIRESDGIALAPDMAVLESLLDANPSCAAVLLTSPSYHGVCCDLEAAAGLCRARGIPLLADAAHGAHLPFLPEKSFESGHALRAVTAAVLSAHKTLPALGQAAFILENRGSGDVTARLRLGAQLAGTSSPSYPVMASLDVARAFLESEGASGALLLCGLLDNYTNPMLLKSCPGLTLDPFRLVLRCFDGALANSWLVDNGVMPEAHDSHTVTLIVALGESYGALSELLSLLNRLKSAQPDNVLPPDDGLVRPQPRPERPMGIRDALLCRDSVTLPLESAVDMIAAEPLTPYPPGVPLLMPGERLNTATAALYPGKLLRFVAKPKKGGISK